LTIADYTGISGLADDNEVFTMDKLSNRTNVNIRDANDVNYVVNNLNNRYRSIDGNNLSYDAAGNLTKDKDGCVYTYDYENRIIKITKDSTDIAEFAYDALGRRIEMKDSLDSNKTRRYYYNPNWQVLCEYDGSENFKMAYVYGNYVDEVLYKKAFSPLGNKYYLHDHLYSTASLVATGGAVNRRYEYDAYGQPVFYSSDFSTEYDIPGYNNRYLFTGRRLDLLDSGSLKMQYNRHRYYDYDTGRWLTHDPLGVVVEIRQSNTLLLVPALQYVDSANLYEYGKSNPLFFQDNLGLRSSDSFGSSFAGCAGCSAGWLDPLPSQGRGGDWGHRRAVLHYVCGFGRPVEFSNTSVFAMRAAEARPGINPSWRPLQELVRSVGRNFCKYTPIGECSGFGFQGVSPEGYWFSGGDPRWYGTLHRGDNDAYSTLTHTVRCCVRRNSYSTATLVCRVRFDIRDTFSFDAASNPSIARYCGFRFDHIVHLDKILSETISCRCME